MSPFVMEEGGITFEFYSSDRDHRPHIHAVKDRQRAKIWLEPDVRVDKRGTRMKKHDVTKARRIVEGNRELMLRRWREFFGA